MKPRTVAPTTQPQWSPPFAGAWAALIFALCTLALGFPALGGGFLINSRSDQFFAGYPFREFAAASLKAGHGIPLWNPYLFGGMPYVGAMHGDIFYPKIGRASCRERGERGRGTGSDVG